jgi:hypothetical protein
MTDDGDSRESVVSLGKISRAAAETEVGEVVYLYHDGDGDLMTYEQLADALDTEAAGLPAEQWRDGVWDVGDYIIEACQVGIYVQVEAVASTATRYSDGNAVWTSEQLRDKVFPAAVKGSDESAVRQLSFEDWIAHSTESGALTETAVVEYTAEDYDDDGEWQERVVAERVIAD